MVFDSSTTYQFEHSDSHHADVLKSHDHPILSKAWREENRGNPDNRDKFDPKDNAVDEHKGFQINTKKLDNWGEMYSVSGNHQPKYQSMEPAKSIESYSKINFTPEDKSQEVDQFALEVDNEAFGKFVYGKHVLPPSRVPAKQVQKFRGRGDLRNWDGGSSGMFQGGFQLLTKTTSARDPLKGIY